ncbi:phenylacetate--CoA ligase family protein [Vibrio mangrovi]|uniref:Phenylacetate--CoA ligase family protein n=1 Tax=Vibrio mangrovi TaxID=474394 RepID=A0A1Y6IRL9_9VIBR|nr:phenylacetate--CoA ligase family protein [Vibrio mangrovi]MDW6003515.1 phenylacetate--CoA ligase family protein [Vibrio mangrovi]SMR99691.1 Phenylacetate-coenzyme A ligase [Vibrio mangrovi]
MNNSTELLNSQWNERINKFLVGSASLDELGAEANELIENIKGYVQRESIFYQSHLVESMGGASDCQSLNNVPYTTKEDLRKVGVEVCSMSFDKVAVYYETTGTTGAPTPCPRAAIDIETSGAYVQHAMEKIYQDTFGTTNAMTAIMGPSELYAFGDTYGEVCRKLSIPYVRLWPESPRVGLDKASELIRTLQVKVLICSPAVALALARLYLSMGFSPRESMVQQILVLGELCSEEMLRSISFIWNANCTHGLYGSQEAHAIGTGCPNGHLHLSETNYVAEIIPVDGLPKECGELCLTMLVPGAKPLIRYRTGDLATILPAASCGCGHPSRVLKVLGRVADIIELGQRILPPIAIESTILGSMEGILNYHIELRASDAGKDWANISLVMSGNHYDYDSIKNQIQNDLGIDINLSIVDELDPQTETGAYVSWKHARIRDLRGKVNG